MSETVYVKFERNSMVYHNKIIISDVGSVYCEDKSIEARVKAIKLVSAPHIKKKTYVFSVMDVIEKITKECPGTDVSSIGECDFIVEYRNKPQKNGALNAVKVFVTCVISFIGSMFTIMAYNNDVGVSELFGKIYELFNINNNGALELSYSIGLTLGIVIFYNHFAGKKLSDTPTPVEVQMRSYETDVDSAVVERAGRKKEEFDVS